MKDHLLKPPRLVYFFFSLLNSDFPFQHTVFEIFQLIHLQHEGFYKCLLTRERYVNTRKHRFYIFGLCQPLDLSCL